MATKPKYRRLSPVARGALLQVLILAAFQDPEAIWTDAEELRDALRFEGIPDVAYDELVGLRWLDVDESGAVSVHDWDEHQWAATEEIGHRWEAAMKKKWRNRKRSSSPAPSPRTRQDTTPQPQDKGPDLSRHVLTGMEEVVGVYEELFGAASDKKLLYLRNILGKAEWTADRVIQGLRFEKNYGATSRNICGRLEAGLKRGDKLGPAVPIAQGNGMLSESVAKAVTQ